MKRLVLLLGVAVLAVGVWVMVSSAGGDAVPEGVAENTEAARPGTAPGASGANTVGEETSETSDAGFERSEVKAMETTIGEQLIPVQVVHKETGKPVPGAEVSYMMDTESQALMEEMKGNQEELMVLARDQEKKLARYGTTVFADDDGFAFVPVAQGTEVTGRHGELYGRVWVQANPPEPLPDGYKLELERDLTLVVEVLDSKGEPAVGVSIALVPRYEGGKEGPEYTHEITRSVAPDGLATFPHVQYGMWELEQSPPIGFFVRPFIPGMDEPGQPVDAAAFPEEPLLVQLPPTGRVVVRTVDGRGEPIPALYDSLNLALAPEDPADLSPVMPLGVNQYARTVEGGETVFDWVVAGKTYVVSAYFAGANDEVERFSGPLAVDHVVRVTLATETEATAFVGRVLDQGLAPLGNAEFLISYELNGFDWPEPFRTDEDGYFSVPIQIFGPERTVSRLTIQSERTYPPTEDMVSYTSAESRSIAVGDNNLGDVILEPTPVIASGRILVDGEPVAGTGYYGFQVEVLEDPAPGGGPERRWTPKWDLRVRPEEGGRFEVLGLRRAVRHRLYSSSGFDHLPFDPIEFNPGADDLEINLRTGGSLQAVAWIDGGISLENLCLRLVPTGGQVPEPADPRPARSDNRELRLRGHSTGVEDGRATFRWRSLWPGSYRFEVMARGATVPTIVFPDIEIVARERNEDPRLDGIDLRGKFRKIVVKVVDPGGQPVPEDPISRPVVVINNRAEDAELHGYSVEGGSTSILTAEPYLDLLVLHEGFKPVERNGVMSDTTVTIEPLAEVVVRFAGGLPELPDDHGLNVSLSLNGRQEDSRRFDSDFLGGTIDELTRPASRVVGETGEMRLQVEGDGTHTVVVSVWNRSSGRSAAIRDIQPAEIEVRASQGEQAFEIRIPEEALQAAIKQLRDR